MDYILSITRHQILNGYVYKCQCLTPKRPGPNRKFKNEFTEKIIQIHVLNIFAVINIFSQNT